MRALIASLLLLFTSLALAAGGDRDPFGTAASNPTFLPVEEAYRLEVEVLRGRGEAAAGAVP